MASITKFDAARALATIGTGLTAGSLLTTSLIISPAMFGKAVRSKEDRLALWSTIFDGVVPIVGPISVISLIAVGLSSYFAPPRLNSILNISQRTLFQFSTAAALIGPVVLGVAAPQAKKLKDAEKSPTTTLDTDKALKQWVVSCVCGPFASLTPAATSCARFHSLPPSSSRSCPGSRSSTCVNGVLGLMRLVT